LFFPFHSSNPNQNATKEGEDCPKKKSTGGKKKVSGYMLFCKETRPIIIKENPDMAFGAVRKELGKRWKALSRARRPSRSQRTQGQSLLRGQTNYHITLNGH
jgi:hypothetical protein